MSMTMEDVAYQMYIEDTIDGYNQCLAELANASTTKEFKKQAVKVNKYLKENESFFGKDAIFMSPAMLENIEAVSGIEKIFNNQEEDKKLRSKQKRIDFAYFVSGAILGFMLNIIASGIYDRYLSN